ncbi:MAG: GFA family protein [Pseudomonadales bacterium]|nr:GFA family protein [Pseudomonadales bacterium]MCP5186085.1 GFA family protein [Pseudomonadales bacterium]
MSTDTHKGSCFCGAVQFEVTGAPNVMGYCHCTDCAHWAGAPVNAFSLWTPSSVKVTKGEDQIGTYARTPGSQRKFCRQCGGHIFTDHPAMGMVDVYLNTVEGVTHKGTLHVFYKEKTMSVPDGLPKYQDMPKEFGGSGVELPE